MSLTESLAQNLELIILDVDGVMTDGVLYIGESGEVFKSFNAKDGIAIQLLALHGIAVAVLSGKSSPSLEYRCKQLRIQHAIFGCNNKFDGVNEIITLAKADPQRTIFCGDDVIDLPAMRICGFSFAPNDAHELVAEYADLVLDKSGGRGCVRELCDRVLKLRCGSLQKAYEPLLSELLSSPNKTEQ